MSSLSVHNSTMWGFAINAKSGGGGGVKAEGCVWWGGGGGALKQRILSY